MKRSNYEIKNTLGMFDFLKGSIMLIVMLSHTAGLFDFLDADFYMPKSFLQAILIIGMIFVYVFGEASMPIMFILSGYGFRKTTFKKCLKRQFKTLIIPYLISMVLVAVINFCAFYIYYGNFHGTASETIRLFKNILLGYAEASPNWFLLALVIGDLIFNQLASILDGKKLLLATTAVSCGGWALSLVGTVPFSLSQGLISTLYICIGYFAKKKRIFLSEYSTKKKVVMIASIFAIALLLRCLGDDMNMSMNIYKLGPATILGNALISLSFIWLFLYLNRFEGPVMDFIRRIGRYSLYVLCIHSIELKSVGDHIQHIFVTRWIGSIAMRNVIQFGVRAFVVLGATFIFVKLKYIYSLKRMASKKAIILRREQA